MVRYGAAKVLIQLKESQVVLDLIDALKDLGIGWLVCSEIVEVSARVGVPAVPILIAALHTKDRVLGRNAATVLAEIAQHHPDPVLRTALPALRRLRNRNPEFGGALEQIEAATGAFKDLPVPAAAPPLDTRILPRPVNTLSDDLMPPPKDWWIRLRRTLRGS